MAYLNLTPFEKEEGAFFQFLNLGGSFTYGDQNNVNFLPRSFRTASNASNAGTAEFAAPPFLTFNPTVVEKGEREFWSTWIAFYRKRLTLLAMYDGGILSYSPTADAAGVRLPVNGYSLQMAYFLTGEEIERRSVVKPKRNFDLRPGKRGPGAWEFNTRFNTFNVDNQVFAAGLSNPADWSHDAWCVDLGLNWYWNPYIKWYFLWHHSEFGNPVLYNSQDGAKSITNELFWVRCQIYF
jgi:phosphate-selective porin OprO/OprP